MNAAIPVTLSEITTGAPSFKATRASQWLSRGILAVTIAAAYVRLFLGVDFTDDAYYSSVPHAFALGAQPYRDELNITQNAAILLAPLYQLYQGVAGSTTGVVLFNRHLYFGLLLACSALTFRVASAYVNPVLARLVAAFVLTFSYVNLPSLSYNTGGAFSLFAGIFFLLLQRAPPRPARSSRLIFWANGCFVTAAFVHPVLLLAALAGLAASLRCAVGAELDPSVRRSQFQAWLASATLGGAAALAFVVLLGPSRLADSLAYARSYGYDFAGLAFMAGRVGFQARYVALFFVPAVALLLAGPLLRGEIFRRTHRILPFLCATISVLVVAFLHHQAGVANYPAASVPLVLSLGGGFALLLFFLADKAQAADLATIVVLPSLLGAGALAFSSTNALHASVLALFPAAICTLLVTARIAQAIDRDAEFRQTRMKALLALLIPLLAFQVGSLLERSYRDEPFQEGRPVFASGPFAGLLTARSKAERLARIRHDLQPLVGRARTLFAFDNFPAGYLLSPLTPRTFSTWIFWPHDPAAGKKLLARVFAADAPPDVVLCVMPVLNDLVLQELKRLDYIIHVGRQEHGYIIFLHRSVAVASPPAPAP